MRLTAERKEMRFTAEGKSAQRTDPSVRILPFLSALCFSAVYYPPFAAGEPLQ